MKEITYAQAICEALDEEMERDDNIVMLGEDRSWKLCKGRDGA